VHLAPCGLFVEDVDTDRSVTVRNFNRPRNSLEIAPERGVLVSNHRYGSPARYTFRYAGDARQNRAMARGPSGRYGGRFGGVRPQRNCWRFRSYCSCAQPCMAKATFSPVHRLHPSCVRHICLRPKGDCAAPEMNGRSANDNSQTLLGTITNLSVCDVELHYREQAPFVPSAKNSSSAQPTSRVKLTPRDRSDFEATFGSYIRSCGGMAPAADPQNIGNIPHISNPIR
jgi:hypothetical protein